MDLIQSHEGLLEVPLHKDRELLVGDGHEQGAAQLRQQVHHDLKGPVVVRLGLLDVDEHEHRQGREGFARGVVSKPDITDGQGAYVEVANIELGVVADTLGPPPSLNGICRSSLACSSMAG